LNAIRAIVAFLAAAMTIGVPLSVWPGLMPEILLISAVFAVFWIPILLFGYVLTKAQIGHHLQRPHVVRNLFIAIAAGSTLCATALPQRLTFFACRNQFDRVIVDLDVLPRSQVERWFGLYYVHGYDTDSRGGTYFQTYQGTDGIGPDILTSGFAWKPNREGSPYGNSQYSIQWLFGNWYSFSASDDW
jgi:hypothetical protein